MWDRLRRLRVKHQLAIAGGLVAVPLIALIGRDIIGHAERTTLVRAEIQGHAALSPYRALLETVPQHRFQVQRDQAGTPSLQAEVESLRRSIDRAVAALQAPSAGAHGAGDAAQALAGQWAALRSERPDGSAAFGRAHVQFLDAIEAGMDEVAARSGLIPSRAPETYRLAQLLVGILPEMVRTLEEARVALVPGQAERPAASPQGQIYALRLAHKQLRRTLSPGAFDEALVRVETALGGLSGDAESDRVDDAPWAAAAMAGILALYDAIDAQLAIDLNRRETELETTRNVEIAVLCVTLGLIFLLLAAISRNITRPIGRVVEICRLLASGRYDRRSEPDVGGDMGIVVGALGDLQEELANEKQTRQQAEAERERLRDQFVQAQKMEALGTLAGGIAHDFNNVIAAIVGQAELAVFASESGKPVDDRLHRVVKAGVRAKSLVQQILAFARPDELAEVELMRPAPLVRETVELAETGLQNPIRIGTEIDDDVGTLLINPSQCHQLLLNVLVNAAHAVGETDGPVVCGLATVRGPSSALPAFTVAPGSDDAPVHTLWAGALEDRDYAVIWVADGGVGMPAETLSRIFDPFFTTRTGGEGSGLGLAATVGIVRAAGGAIHVGTTPGAGTRFDIYLPIHVDDSLAPADEDVAATGPVTTGRILLVDDNADALDALATALRAQGHTVVDCPNGAAALAAFQGADPPFDMVISDQTMTELAGLDLIAEIHKTAPGVLAILMTGHLDKVLRTRAADTGVAEVAEKPFQTATLLAMVQRVLGRSKDAGH